MISHLELGAQTNTELILPTEQNGSVQLNISAFSNTDVENFGYDYLAVFVIDEEGKYGTSAVQGKHTIKNDYLVFSPHFPFERRMSYMVKSKYVDSNNGHSYQSFQVGEKPTFDKAKIISIYPSSNQLPENLLRFYIYFNTPMQKGQALNYIQLVDSKGNMDAKAFMEFKQELWSLDGKRLTLLFDPGRIKRGVSTNLEIGPALLNGKRYQLKISNEWKDVYGQPLSDDKTKSFLVKEAYRHQIKINKWHLSQPNANSYDALSIHFDRIMDHALIQSMIHIEDEEKNLIDGYWEVLENEKRIQFIPEEKWQKGNYQIVFDVRLEDLAGNNLNSLLDESVSQKNHHNEATNLKIILK